MAPHPLQLDASQEPWRDRPVLVTGAAGLLGSWLVSRLLERGARVVVLLRDLVPDALVVVERSGRSGPLPWPAGLTGDRERQYGETMLWYGRPTTRP